MFNEQFPLVVAHVCQVCLAYSLAVHGTQETGIETVAGTNGADYFIGRNLWHDEVICSLWRAYEDMPCSCRTDEYGTERLYVLAVYLLGIACAEEDVKVVGTASDNGTQPAVLLYHGQQFLLLVDV